MLCGKCRKETRVPGQRWGAACRRNYMRDYMRALREAKASAEHWKTVRTKPPIILSGPLTFRPA